MNPTRRLQDLATKTALTYGPALQEMGLKQGTVGYNRAMFNAIDMAHMDERLAANFIQQLPAAVQQGATIEAMAKARADSFRDPASGQWVYDPAVFKGYSDLYAEQRRRASGYDYMGAIS
jgi:hypothetical protein